MLEIAGIAGIIGTGRNEQRGTALGAMLGCLRRRPLDEYGTWIDERLGLWSGWVAREGSAPHFQSLWNEQHDILLLFSGEDYQDQTEVDQLHARGHEIEPEGAGYLVHLYEEMGLKLLEKLNGTFRGLLVDLREQKVVLFNDRYGINRLYFHKNEHGFYFSSEAKALLGVLPHARALDPTSLGEVFSCGCVLQNRTIFRGISLMPGGSAWTFRPGEDVRKEYYFSKELWEQQPTLSEAEYYERMKDTWKRILPRYFRGDERMALSLTGGVDSRMILAWAGRAAGTLPCYTFGGQYRECADVRISRQVAGLCGQPHEVLQVGNEFLGQFSSLAAQTVYLSDGTMDVTGAIDLYVQQAARDIAAVRITGTNGGEILRSIVAFKPMPLCESVFDTEFLQHFRSAAATYAKELQCHHLSFTAFKQAAWHMASKFVVERSGLILRMPYFDNDLVKLVYQAPPESTASNDVSLRLIADGNPALANIGTDRGIALKSKPGVGRARNLFQEFLFKTEYAYDYGMPQWLARLDHALAPLRLERLFLGRHKFHHFRVFYRDELSGYLREVLLDPRSVSRSYLHRSGVEKILNGHLKGNRNYTLEIHKLLTAELVQRELIERYGRSGALALKPSEIAVVQHR